MAVYKHKNAKSYTYDFVFNGVRFRDTTGETVKREALKIEARMRASLEKGTADAASNKREEMKLRDAAGRYWNEKAQYEASARDTFGQIGNLVDGLGPDTLLSRITTNELVRYQATERERRSIANRTINAEVPELISLIFKRAEKMWRKNVGEKIDWAELKLLRPTHRTRSASRHERVMLLRALRPDYRPIIRFAFLSGLRKAALIVRKDQIDWDMMVLKYTKKSKRTGNIGYLPITTAMEKILRSQLAKSDPKCPFIFSYVCKRSRQERSKGKRYPVTYSGISMAIKPAIKASGITDWRGVHDMRHTAATDTLRSSQNLKAVQMMLGHSDIAQTSRYAHVIMEDVRKAMEGSPRKSPVILAETAEVDG